MEKSYHGDYKLSARMDAEMSSPSHDIINEDSRDSRGFDPFAKGDAAMRSDQAPAMRDQVMGAGRAVGGD